MMDGITLDHRQVAAVSVAILERRREIPLITELITEANALWSLDALEVVSISNTTEGEIKPGQRGRDADIEPLSSRIFPIITESRMEIDKNSIEIGNWSNIGAKPLIGTVQQQRDLASSTAADIRSSSTASSTASVYNPSARIPSNGKRDKTSKKGVRSSKNKHSNSDLPLHSKAPFVSARTDPTSNQTWSSYTLTLRALVQRKKLLGISQTECQRCHQFVQIDFAILHTHLLKHIQNSRSGSGTTSSLESLIQPCYRFNQFSAAAFESLEENEIVDVTDEIDSLLINGKGPTPTVPGGFQKSPISSTPTATVRQPEILIPSSQFLDALEIEIIPQQPPPISKLNNNKESQKQCDTNMVQSSHTTTNPEDSKPSACPKEATYSSTREAFKHIQEETIFLSPVIPHPATPQSSLDGPPSPVDEKEGKDGQQEEGDIELDWKNVFNCTFKDDDLKSFSSDQGSSSSSATEIRSLGTPEVATSDANGQDDKEDTSSNISGSPSILREISLAAIQSFLNSDTFLNTKNLPSLDNDDERQAASAVSKSEYQQIGGGGGGGGTSEDNSWIEPDDEDERQLHGGSSCLAVQPFEPTAAKMDSVVEKEDEENDAGRLTMMMLIPVVNDAEVAAKAYDEAWTEPEEEEEDDDSKHREAAATFRSSDCSTVGQRITTAPSPRPSSTPSSDCIDAQDWAEPDDEDNQLLRPHRPEAVNKSDAVGFELLSCLSSPDSSDRTTRNLMASPNDDHGQEGSFVDDEEQLEELRSEISWAEPPENDFTADHQHHHNDHLFKIDGGDEVSLARSTTRNGKSRNPSRGKSTEPWTEPDSDERGVIEPLKISGGHHQLDAPTKQPEDDEEDDDEVEKEPANPRSDAMTKQHSDESWVEPDEDNVSEDGNYHHRSGGAKVGAAGEPTTSDSALIDAIRWEEVDDDDGEGSDDLNYERTPPSSVVDFLSSQNAAKSVQKSVPTRKSTRVRMASSKVRDSNSVYLSSPSSSSVVRKNTGRNSSSSAAKDEDEFWECSEDEREVSCGGTVDDPTKGTPIPVRQGREMSSGGRIDDPTKGTPWEAATGEVAATTSKLGVFKTPSKPRKFSRASTPKDGGTASSMGCSIPGQQSISQPQSSDWVEAEDDFSTSKKMISTNKESVGKPSSVAAVVVGQNSASSRSSCSSSPRKRVGQQQSKKTSAKTTSKQPPVLLEPLSQHRRYETTAIDPNRQSERSSKFTPPSSKRLRGAWGREVATKGSSSQPQSPPLRQSPSSSNASKCAKEEDKGQPQPVPVVAVCTTSPTVQIYPSAFHQANNQEPDSDSESDSEDEGESGSECESHVTTETNRLSSIVLNHEIALETLVGPEQSTCSAVVDACSFPIECLLCSADVPFEKDALLSHLYSHRSPFRCPICAFSSHEMYRLGQHIVETHRLSANDEIEFVDKRSEMDGELCELIKECYGG